MRAKKEENMALNTHRVSRVVSHNTILSVNGIKAKLILYPNSNLIANICLSFSFPKDPLDFKHLQIKC